MLIFNNYHDYIHEKLQLRNTRHKKLDISIADTINTYIGFLIIFHKEKSIGSKSIGTNLLGSYYLGSQSIGSHSLGSYYRGSQL